MPYGVGRRAALLDGPADHVTACDETLDHLDAAKLLVVQVEEHHLVLQTGYLHIYDLLITLVITENID
ncbi:hypothetical protein ACFV90_25005 [Streptomyces sp. NPDC059904]|uniref:hypothetical protein n=1 Tax=Streptomyces sp. NPDC059904 TaxID=3346996 RepID=UPI00364FDF8B